ncbi:nuclear transport factor 2 family protein [Proteobacteria bacterium 005FR1]|nr:nuclear transport factor 2 family protein [Proteobacteria bacterium 005FR1]
MSNQLRTAQEVLEDHLEKARQGEIEGDLRQNYAEEVVFLGNYGIHHGHRGARDLAQLLKKQLPDAEFEYCIVQVEGEFGFLQWTAEASNGAHVDNGADSFVIRGGKIIAQTIYYTC